MQELLAWIGGDLGPQARIWTALAPALLLCAYFIVGLLVYVVRCAIRGQYRDPEVESRGQSVLANMWIRLYFIWLMQPVWRGVLRSGIPPTAITTLSFLLGLASGASFAGGRFALGGWLYIFSGVCDIMDGRLARSTGKVTRAGGALDSILDRYADSAVLCGLGWYFRDSWVLAPALIALVGSSLVPYIRARGEAAGIVMKEVGVMQRAERILYLGVGCALSPVVEVILDPTNPRPLHRLGVVGIVLLAVATQLTSAQRLMHLLSQLSQGADKAWFAENRRPIRRGLVAASTATLIDFVCVLTAVTLLHLSPPVATAAGCVLGAVVNYVVNRLWAYASHEAKLPQIRRYAFVSVTSALLNSGGVAVLLMLPELNLPIAWTLVRGAVFFAWNFPLHRDYVFISALADNGSQPRTA